MIGASLYIIRCTARNRIRARLRRLREPRYLAGALAGIAYIYATSFGRFRAQRQGMRGRRNRGAPESPAAALAALGLIGPAIGGTVLMAAAAAAWVLPMEGTLLEFSKAEVQFLFTAPVSRRALILHRMLRSQIGILFSALIVGVVAPSMGGYARLRMSVGMWLLMCTLRIYFTGVGLARARLRDVSARARRVAWMPLVAVAVVLAIVAGALWFDLHSRPAEGARELFERLAAAVTHGLPGLVMWPFRTVVAPLFAAWPGPYLQALAGAVVILGASVAWVVSSDAAFEDAASEIADRKAKEPVRAAVRYRARSTAWRLAPTGRAEVAFVWKGLTQTLRVVDMRTLLRMIAIVLALTVAGSVTGRARSVAAMAASFALAGAGFAVLFAPQAVRLDLRQDLEHLELMKTWPVASGDVIRGEILWPGLLITAAAWVLIVMATLLSALMFSDVGVGLRLAVGTAAFVAAPALVFGQLVIHNAATLLFPAWVPLGTQRPRGLDAMGQRLIMLGGTWLALLVMALPGAIAGVVIWFALHRLMGPAAVVAGALAGTAAVAIEVLVATETLGPLYDRLDLLAVERAE